MLLKLMMCLCFWFADVADARRRVMMLIRWCCKYCCWTNTANAADNADKLIRLMLLILLICWCCWFADAELIKAVAADTAEELIRLMLLILLMCVCFCCCWFGLSDFSLYCDHCHQSHHGIYVQVVDKGRCVLKKWARCCADSHRALWL